MIRRTLISKLTDTLFPYTTLFRSREATAHGLTDAKRRRVRDRPQAIHKSAFIQTAHDFLNRRIIGGGYVVERQGVSFRNGRVTKTQRIAGDKDPAPCAMETCLAPAARAGHIEGVIASAVTPTRKGEANDWLVRKFPLIGQEKDRKSVV